MLVWCVVVYSVLKTGLNRPVQRVTGCKTGLNITGFLASYELVRTERFSGATNFFCPTDSTGHTYLDSNGVPEWWRSARRRTNHDGDESGRWWKRAAAAEVVAESVGAENRSRRSGRGDRERRQISKGSAESGGSRDGRSRKDRRRAAEVVAMQVVAIEVEE